MKVSNIKRSGLSLEKELRSSNMDSGRATEPKRLRLENGSTSPKALRKKSDSGSSGLNSKHSNEKKSGVHFGWLNTSNPLRLCEPASPRMGTSISNKELSHSLESGENKNTHCRRLRSEDSDVETAKLDEIIADSENHFMRVKASENAIKGSIPPPIKLPLFLPKQNLNEQWTFSRVFSEEIHSTFDKHLNKFEGEYLSRYLLGEIFHEKVNEEDTDFDPSIFFQAVQVTRIGQLFIWGNGSKRLVMECHEIPTANNIHLSDAEKKRKIIAEGTLAELLASCSKEGDFFIIFGDILLEQSKLITLNSRYQHSISIAQYRHDGVFRPPAERTDGFEEFIRPYRNERLIHSFEEHEESEVLIKVEPNVPEIESGTVMWQSSSLQNVTEPGHGILPEFRRRIMDSPKKGASIPSTPMNKRRDAPRLNSCELSDESDLQIDIVKEIEENGILDASKGSPSPLLSSPMDSSTPLTCLKESEIINDHDGVDTFLTENSPVQTGTRTTEPTSPDKHDRSNVSNEADRSENLFEVIQLGTQHHFVIGDKKEDHKNHGDQKSKAFPIVKDCSVKLQRLNSSQIQKYRKQPGTSKPKK